MKILETLKEEFPANFIELVDASTAPKPTSEEVMGLPVNGKQMTAFETHHEVAVGVDHETEVARVVRHLFETNPKAKVYNVSFSPSFEIFTTHKISGTITISGVF